MKVLVILSRFPYPLEKGDKLRAYHQLAHLHKHMEVTLCCLTDKNPTEDELAAVHSICSELHVFKLNRIKQLFRLAYALFSSKPFQVHFFYQKSIAEKIKTVIQESAPDHIFAQLIRTSEYVKHFHEVPKTLDYMDALNKNYSRRIKKSRGLRKFLVKEEAKRLISYEHLIFDYFEHHTIISEQDKRLIYHEKRDDIQVIPNGVDFDYFSSNQEGEKKTDLLFTGNMGYLPNQDAAFFLAQEVMPALWKIDSDITLTLAGASPSSELLSLAEKRIRVTGWVEDMRDEFNSSHIYIAPMRQGTGLQNKLLEAMSMELPCITTSLANNALHAIPNEHLYVYENTEHLVSLVMHLLGDEKAREEMGAKARAFILENYSWESANKKLSELITNP